MQQTLPERACTRRNAIVLAAIRQHQIDGIYDYTRRLAETLATADSVEVTVRNPRSDSIHDLISLLPPADDATLTILLQYNPFSFGRWGFAPWLPAKLWRLKRSSSRLRIAVMVHETYLTNITDWRSALMGAWQRVQFFAVGFLSDVLFTSIGGWAAELQKRRFTPRVHHLPVASNLPDMRHARDEQRERLGIEDETIVLAAFGTGHPSRMMDYISTAAAEIATRAVPAVLLNLGSGAPDITVDPSIRVVTPGHLAERDIARHLAAADIYLAPFVDGVSTRRTTIMAALQHGLPIIGTDGFWTDAMLRNAIGALELTPVGDPEAFAVAAGSLAVDHASRVARGIAARRLYEEEFDWSIVSARLLKGLFADGQGQRNE